VAKRTQVLFKMKQLLEEHLDELTNLCAQEHGKKWDEAAATCSRRSRLWSLPAVPSDDEGRVADERLDRLRYCPVSRAAGRIRRHRAVELSGYASAGWMAPICIVTGNCIVLKVASFVPQSAMRISELWKQAGLPDGVLNLVTPAQ